MVILFWILKILLAIITFLLVEWLLPVALGYIHLVPPGPIVFLVALACGVAVLLFNYWYPRLNSRLNSRVVVQK